MIVADRKQFKEIQDVVRPYKKLMILGCGTCVAVCMAGGEKEVALLASQLRMANKLENKDVEIVEATIQRQCDREYIEAIIKKAKECDAVLSMACGAGVQMVADMLEPMPVAPALNTRFIGITLAEGMWAERCRACGSCVLADFGGICPMTMCAKSLINGPCGGSKDGKCETSPERDCAWVLIYNRLKKMGKLDNMRQPTRLKDYRTQAYPARQINDAYLKPVKTEVAAK
ncbi:MAG: methylenetetrahydrofolate reductase C-terminal domain-containing protein [Chloroflexi bacterium]|nr:methylenetetrahydrofolate reductase C-terminal domain-containing protein [Chloroflexota bacterium]